MKATRDPRSSHLLAALAEEPYQRLLPDLELIAMPLGWVLYESGMPLNYVYFPVSGCIRAILRRLYAAPTI